jgi:uncharacterized membrane protein
VLWLWLWSCVIVASLLWLHRHVVIVCCCVVLSLSSLTLHGHCLVAMVALCCMVVVLHFIVLSSVQPHVVTSVIMHSGYCGCGQQQWCASSLVDIVACLEGTIHVPHSHCDMALS